jgi:hypothetical protein
MNSETFQNKKQIFKAVTKHSGKLKTLFEVIFSNMTVANWKIDKKGMFLEEMTNQNLLMNIFLPAESFQEYFFEGETMYIGLGNHINKEFFKSVKNKDVITMSMTEPFFFNFEKINQQISQSLCVSIQDIQVITPAIFPSFQTSFIELLGDNFNQLCRSFTSYIVNLTKKNNQIEFSFDTGRSIKKLICGTLDELNPVLIHRSFSSEQFSRISKIHTFTNSPIKVFYEENKPLCFICESLIGCLKILIHEKIND